MALMNDMAHKIKDNYDYNLSYMNQDGGIITDKILNANLFCSNCD